MLFTVVVCDEMLAQYCWWGSSMTEFIYNKYSGPVRQQLSDNGDRP